MGSTYLGTLADASPHYESYGFFCFHEFGGMCLLQAAHESFNILLQKLCSTAFTNSFFKSTTTKSTKCAIVG